MSKRNKLMLFAVAAVLASSAQVSADDTFYIIRDGQGPCKVVEGHPPGTVTIIGNNKTYTTREAAEKDMALACKTG